MLTFLQIYCQAITLDVLYYIARGRCICKTKPLCLIPKQDNDSGDQELMITTGHGLGAGGGVSGDYGPLLQDAPNDRHLAKWPTRCWGMQGPRSRDCEELGGQTPLTIFAWLADLKNETVADSQAWAELYIGTSAVYQAVHPCGNPACETSSYSSKSQYRPVWIVKARTPTKPWPHQDRAGDCIYIAQSHVTLPELFRTIVHNGGDLKCNAFSWLPFLFYSQRFVKVQQKRKPYVGDVRLLECRCFWRNFQANQRRSANDAARNGTSSTWTFMA